MGLLFRCCHRAHNRGQPALWVLRNHPVSQSRIFQQRRRGPGARQLHPWECPTDREGKGLCATKGSAVSPVHMLTSPSISPTKLFFFFYPPTYFAETKILCSSVSSPSSLPLDFFLPVLLRKLSMHHCISLRGST